MNITINGIPYVSPTDEAEKSFEIALHQKDIDAVRTMISSELQRGNAWLLSLYASRLPWRKVQGNAAITDELMLVAIDAVVASYTETNWKGWLHAMHFLMASDHLLSKSQSLDGPGYDEQRRIAGSRIEDLYKKVFEVAVGHDLEGVGEDDWLIRGMPHQLIGNFVMAAPWNANAERFGITPEVVSRFYEAGSHTGKVRSRGMVGKERERLIGQSRRGFASERLEAIWKIERDIEFREFFRAELIEKPELQPLLRSVEDIDAELEKLREKLFAQKLLVSAG